MFYPIIMLVILVYPFDMVILDGFLTVFPWSPLVAPGIPRLSNSAPAVALSRTGVVVSLGAGDAAEQTLGHLLVICIENTQT